MTAKYFAILTNQGAARLANAAALGTKLNLTQMAVGDANGTLPTPDPAQTKLINQKRIAPLNLLTVDPTNISQIIAEQIIPENEGGFWIREIGLYDDDGILIAVANCPETYKPQLQEGSGRTQTIRMILIVSSTSSITLKIDPSVVLATRQYVDDRIIEVKNYVDGLMRDHEQSRNHPDATTTAKGFTQLNSSVTDDRETQAATTKAVKIAMDNANARLAKERNGADIPNTALFIQNLGFSSYIKGLIGQGNQWDTWQYLGLVDALNSKQQADETLTALAGLVNGANKLPYFSGVDQMATADLTAFARGLLGKADAATAKGHLGVGSAGGRNVGTGFSAGGSEIPDMTFFAGLKGSAGYQYFPTGMLLQWGTVVLKSAPSGVSIGTFPVAFPAAGQQIFVTHDNPLANVMAFGAASIIDPTQFRVNAIAINADTFTMAPGYSLTLRWFAIGS
ncbi:phage tail protein [Enterobacter roggenkampii]|jgi:phage-related tail fiber protein|uniref:phage tail protein n=2 Tax=Enterobacter roggenkampii TaxID=1812935 RepID=UPI000A6800AC|nr:phage tail protein [Enterobacter roggenkampii]DAL50120.1 MAG TPA_asm: tail collar fiber protein [Caudoviricetes sp.]